MRRTAAPITYFNPRPRKEGDIRIANNDVQEENISIHALVKRATHIALPTIKMVMISIHALVKRATVDEVFDGQIWAIFQSTPS